MDMGMDIDMDMDTDMCTYTDTGLLRKPVEISQINY
jgi:hypothetical protein